MSKIFSGIWATLKNLFKSKVGIVVMAIILMVGGYFLFFNKSTTHQFITVRRGSVTEIVSLTGNTTSAQNVSLSFGSSGIISRVHSDLGERVYAGQTLAELNMNDLVAGLHQAQAQYDSQVARLNDLKKGTSPENLAVTETALANAYQSALDALYDSYNKSEDAIRAQTAEFFLYDEEPSPKVSFDSTETDARVLAAQYRYQSGKYLDELHNALSTVSAQNRTEVETLLATSRTDVRYFLMLFSYLDTALGGSSGLNPATLAAYKAYINAGRTELNAALSAISTKEQIIKNTKKELELKKSGSTAEEIAYQEAMVEAAQASVESAMAKIQNAKIVSPISGTVTQFDAKIGQLASPNMPLVSIMSDAGYEVDAGISEMDIGKVSVDNTVTMTLDAFPNEIFEGSVFYIAPAETNTQGVISYQVKISFNKQDPRMKSGLTANIDIETRQKNDILILPQYAILQNDQGTFVEIVEADTIKENPVVLGIQDQDGNVEVISGVTEGQQVLNIGLKTK